MVLATNRQPGDTIAAADINGIAAEVNGKQDAGSYAAASHSHTIGDVTGLQSALNGKAASSHNHDDRYYTETEADGRFVRTVNGTGPDGSGDVAVAGGGGGTGFRSPIVFPWSNTINERERHIGPLLFGTGSNNLNPTGDTVYLFRMELPVPTLVDAIVSHHSAGTDAGGTFRLLLYGVDDVLLPTGLPLIDTGPLTTDTPSISWQLPASMTLEGRYYIGYRTDGPTGSWQTPILSGPIAVAGHNPNSLSSTGPTLFASTADVSLDVTGAVDAWRTSSVVGTKIALRKVYTP